MQMLTLGWVLTRLTSRALVLGAMALASALPATALALQGGKLADRASRRDILVFTQAALGLLALGLAALSFSGALALPHLFVFAALLGVVTSFDLPAAQAFAPELVPREDIPRAVALMQAILHGSRLVGPAIAGVAIELWGEGSAFLANGVSFLAVIASLVAIPAGRSGAGAPARGRGGAAEGVRYAWGEPVVRRLLALVFACMVLVFPFTTTLMPYYARYVVHADASEMGAIMSTSGFGAVAGAAALVVFGARAWRWRVAGGLACAAFGIVGLGLTRGVTAALPLVASQAFGVSVLLGTISQVVQERVPNAVRGRVTSLVVLGRTSVMPLASLALAALADAAGFERLMIGCGAAFGVLSAAIAAALPRDPRDGTPPATP
jgi:MFS family permease